MLVSLKRRGSSLAVGRAQLALLNDSTPGLSALPKFFHQVGAGLRPRKPEIMQLNLGKMCNQTCKHCHVDAGPDRSEVMSKATMDRCLEIVREHSIPIADLTGGAPELNPNFHWLVEQLSHLGKTIPGFRLIDRCNLTIILSNANFRLLPEFLSRHRVNVVSSLPHFTKRFTDRQRGEGVHERSIEALRMLNAVGYGLPGSGLQLDLVYNPSGTFLPGRQSELEAQFRGRLRGDYQIEFNSLFALTNLPISRFLEHLIESSRLEEYMEQLISAFNPAAVAGLMCRNTVSVGWDGKLYDCDFNQMLEIPAEGAVTIENVEWKAFHERTIMVDQHCYGCTAGCGSSCGGALVG